LLAILVVGTPLLGAQAAAPERPGKRAPLELLQAAHTLFLQKDYEGAREYYLEVLPSYPRNFNILKNLAYCFYKRGPRGYAQAASYYSRAYEINPGSAEVAENLARCLLGLNRAGEAAAIYQRMAERPGSPATAWKRTAEAYDAAGRPQQAEAAYDAYLQRNPGDLDARAKLGDLFARAKAYARAQEQYRMVLSANPNSPSGLIGMARLSAWQGQYQESLRLYDRVLRLNPSNAEAEVGKAFVLLWSDRYEEAQALLQQLRQRHPGDSEIARGLEQAEAALRLRELTAAGRAGDTARIEAFYRERMKGNPNDIAALKALAEVTATPARCSESIEFSRRGLELTPTDTDLELRMARSMVLCQQYAEAIARYQHVLAANPKAAGALYEFGFALLRARRNPEAMEAFRQVLQINPSHADANMGLALALASNRDYQEALLRYDEILKRSPDNYDALQGKASVLYWTGQYTQARAIFQDLAAKRPDDAQNTEALKGISSAEEEAKWTALRPASGAPPQDLLAYYEKRLAAYPDDLQALKGRAYAQAQLNNFPAAIQAYRQVLEKYPDDRTSKMELARLSGRQGQYDVSVKYYREVLKDSPDDLEALESLGRVYVWSKQDREALPIYQGLLARNPTNNDYRLELARLQLRLQDYVAARQALTAVLAADPQNRDAHLDLAPLDLRQGDRGAALQHFDAVLKQNPKDSAALLGKAQIAYYQGNLRQAYATTSELVAAQPDSFDAVFLLASIEHARHHRRQSLELLDRAAKLSPGNSEVLAMRQRIREESVVTFRTSASYARELGTSDQFGTHEDLRYFSYGTTLGFSGLPRTDSFLTLSYLPSNSPLGGIRGAVGPAQFLYRQTTRFSDHFTLRAGAGMVRFGPGTEVVEPGDPDPLRYQLAKQSPIGLAGITIAPVKKFSIDLDASRSAISYTPTSTRLGVIQERLSGGLNFFFTSRTELHLEYFYGRYSTRPFDFVNASTGQAVATGVVERNWGHGGSIDFTQVVYTSKRFSFDAGYEGRAFGFRGNSWLGFFSPGFYQRHLGVGRIYGNLFGPVDYDISGGVGTQQTEQGTDLKRGYRASPALTFRVSRHFSFTLGYTYYTASQALGTLRGNAVRFTTDWISVSRLMTGAPLRAAEPPPEKANWDNLKSLAPGEEIQVVLKDAKSYRGRLQAVSDEAITVRLAAGEQSIARQDILRVSAKGNSHRLRNALIGAGIGAGITGVAVAASIRNDPEAINGVAVIPIVALVGAGVGAVMPTGGWHDVYRAR
jgi:tetratricopeptide (TPR) repeat protein